MTEKMKPSGITWIGDIPETWKVKKLRFILDENGIKVGPFGSSLSSGDYCDEGKWVYNQRTVLDDEFSIADTCISEEKYREMIGFKVNSGDMLITSRGTIGKVAIVPEGAPEGILHPCIIKFSLDREQVVDRLLKRIFNETDFIRDQLSYLSNATTIEVIYSYTLKDVYLPIAPIDEQRTIANFLDTQCTKIDSVIADIEKQIELLQKYKKSLITETVTNGLDRSVPMKDSGIEWIGNVPAHWQVKRLSYECERIGDIDHYMPDSVDNGIPYIMTGDLIGDGNQIDFENCKQISEQDYLRLSRKMKPIRNDIIFARYATIGTVRIVDFDKEFLVSYSCAIVRPKETLHSKYLFYYLKSTAFYEEISKYINTNTQGNVGIDSLGRAKIPVPLIEEQVAISDFLNKKCELIDNVLSHKQRQLEAIQQHKKSLIYEYVTGKKRVKEVG